VSVQALQPRELVIVFWTGLGVSVRGVDRGDDHAVNGRREIATLPVGYVAWQVHASHNASPSRKYRHAVPAPLGVPNRMITGLPDYLRRKLGVRGFEFLKADDVGLISSNPAEQVRQATVDVVDVETGDFHRFSWGHAAWVRTSGAVCQPPPITVRLRPDRCQLLEFLTRGAVDLNGRDRHPANPTAPGCHY
jgi:hypothetical protein